VRMDELTKTSGRVTGIGASDLLTGARLEVAARHVVLATGAWTGQGDGLDGDLRVRPSKGVHIVVPRNRITMDTGLLMRTEKSVLFVIPWGEHWLIGDTDTEWPFDPSAPVASRADIDYLLAKVNHMLREPLTAADIEGVFAGLRPLVAASDGADTTKLSREHAVRSPAPGLSVIAGGKYTTYRVMARDLIDVAVRDLGAGPGPLVQGSCTHQVPLAGADGYHDMWESRADIAESAGLPLAQIERLLGRYGSDLNDLLALVARGPALKEPVPGGDPYVGAEIVYACSHEGAVHLDDVLSRRTRIRIELRDRGAGVAPYAAKLMAAELGWDQAGVAAEISRYLDMVAADLAAESMPDDQSAFEAATKSPRRAGHGLAEGPDQQHRRGLAAD
jgi:glycerol-3-phosphate dehydrogenase